MMNAEETGSAIADAPQRVVASSEAFTMMQVCREVGMTYQTLKFYCNKGLVPNVKRDKNNRRMFDEHDVEWIKSLTCLKRCGSCTACGCCKWGGWRCGSIWTCACKGSRPSPSAR